MEIRFVGVHTYCEFSGLCVLRALSLDMYHYYDLLYGVREA